MRRRSAVRCTVLAASLAAFGCGSRMPAGPTPLVEGTWTGSIVHGQAGNGTTVLTMSQTGAGVSGTWSADFAGAAFDTGGSIGGMVTGTTVSLFLTPAASLVCGPGLTLSGTLAVDGSVSGDRLTGTFVILTCEGAESGSVDVTRTN